MDLKYAFYILSARSGVSVGVKRDRVEYVDHPDPAARVRVQESGSVSRRPPWGVKPTHHVEVRLLPATEHQDVCSVRRVVLVDGIPTLPRQLGRKRRRSAPFPVSSRRARSLPPKSLADLVEYLDRVATQRDERL